MNSARFRFRVPSGPSCGRQGGFSLWELTVLLGILGVALVAGFTLLNASRAYQIETGRLAQLAAADRALAGFIATSGRLPCPDTSGDGQEDCGGSAQKGWLPVVTLGLGASAPARGLARLAYVVYRGAGADLTVLAAGRYNPLMLPTLLNAYSTIHTFNQLNMLDFCAGLTLATAATTTPVAASAHIPGAAGAPVNVAYALAESGLDSDGDGNPFDGLNTTTASPQLESPARPGDTGYDDLVRSRRFVDLGLALNCPQATRSVDAVAHAVEVNVTVNDFRLANLSNAGVLALNAGIAVAMNITAAALAAGSAIAGGVVLAEATAELSAAIASCAVLVGCAFIPQAAAAVAAATAGLAIAAAALVTYGISFPINTAAVLAAIIATGKAGVTGVTLPATPSEILSQLQTAANEAAARAVTARADATAARTAATNARTTYNNSVSNVYNVAHTYDAAHSNDALLAAAIAAYVTYAEAQLAASNATGEAQAKRLEANNAAAAIPAAIAERDAAIADAQANPTDASKQSLAESRTKAVIALQNRAATLALAATAAEQAAATLATAAVTASSNYNTARTTALNAYSIAHPNENSRAAISSALTQANLAYDQVLIKERAATSLEFSASTKEANAVALQKAYNDLLAAGIGGGSTQGGPALAIFSGAEDILKLVDFKGVLE